MANKTSKKSNRRKYNGPKKKYPLGKIKTLIVDDAAVNTMGIYEQKLSDVADLAVSIALDASDRGIKLDFSRESESLLDRALLNKGMALLDEGIEESEIRKVLVELGAAYLLFEQVNLVESFKVHGDIVYAPEVSDNLLIKARLPMSSNYVLFDPRASLHKVEDICFVFKDIKPRELGVKAASADDISRALAINLDAYRDIVVKELLEKL